MKCYVKSLVKFLFSYLNIQDKIRSEGRGCN
jgi:hypothetical protein